MFLSHLRNFFMCQFILEKRKIVLILDALIWQSVTPEGRTHNYEALSRFSQSFDDALMA